MNDTPGLPSAEDLIAIVASAEQAGRAAMEAGALDKARDVYQELLGLDPNNAQALNGMGILALQDGDAAEAERLLRAAADNAGAWPDPHQNLGMLLLSQGRTRRALRAIEKSVELSPNNTDLLYARATAYKLSGRVADSETDLQSIIAIDETHAEAYNDLGVMDAERGRADGAVANFRRAAESPKAQPTHWANLGNMYLLVNAVADAAQAFRAGLDGHGDSPDLLMGIAVCERRQGALSDALSHAESALAKMPAESPNRGAALNLLGTVRRELGDLDGARESFEDALAIQAGNASARSNLGLLQLLNGDWRNGFDNFEARRNDPGWQIPWGGVQAPDWDGGDLNGKSLIVLSEQGLGDSIQFARLIPALADSADTVHVAVHPPLVPLIEGVDSRLSMIRPGMAPPAVDAKVLMLSLPKMIGMTGADDVSGAPYLTAPEASDGITDVLASMRGLKVGVNWRGAPAHKEDFKRSIQPVAFAPITETEGASFVSLSFGFDDDALPDGVADVSEHVSDFADSAALIAGLDLVITVDTATAHLAGALGVPCWTLLPFVPDWRWGMSGETTPWYDSMRLYRQSALNDWADVLERVSDDLAARAAST